MRRCSRGLLALGLLMFGSGTGILEAQLRIGGSLTARTALEQYGGDLSAVTQPLVDSAEIVFAAASEWEFLLQRGFAGPTRRVVLTAEGALRQLTTGGFLQRNYAPREHGFLLQSEYTEILEAGTVTFDANVDTRGVAGLPPMPMYLQPGYLAYSAVGGFTRPVTDNTDVDGHIGLEEKNYAGPSVLPTLDYLDRRSIELQAGVSRLFRGAPGTEGFSTVRAFAAYQHHRYPLQGHRRDHAVQVGGRWHLERWDTWGLRFTLNASGVVNRSNSSRVEYNLARIEATGRQRVGGSYLVQLTGIWSGKSYVSPQEFLVPGEEADNAAIFEGEITRFLGAGMSASMGGSWTRAETNVSGDYYRRVRVYVGLQRGISF